MNKIFKNKKILITGHTGFKGSWLTFWLKSLDAKICGVSKDVPTNPSLFNTLKLKKSILVEMLGGKEMFLISSFQIKN